MNEKQNHKHSPSMWHRFTNVLCHTLSQCKIIAALLWYGTWACFVLSVLWVLDVWDDHKEFLIGVAVGIVLGSGLTLYLSVTPLNKMMAKAELADHYKESWWHSVKLAEHTNKSLINCYEAWELLFKRKEKEFNAQQRRTGANAGRRANTKAGN